MTAISGTRRLSEVALRPLTAALGVCTGLGYALRGGHLVSSGAWEDVAQLTGAALAQLPSLRGRPDRSSPTRPRLSAPPTGILVGAPSTRLFAGRRAIHQDTPGPGRLHEPGIQDIRTHRLTASQSLRRCGWRQCGCGHLVWLPPSSGGSVVSQERYAAEPRHPRHHFHRPQTLGLAIRVA